MSTVLFTTRSVSELAPIADSSCKALLSVACKPLVVHTVESLAMAGVKDVIIVVSPDARAVEETLGNGARWGMHFDYVRATSGESEDCIVERIRSRLSDEYLLVRGDMLRTPIITEFLTRARSFQARSVIATIGGVEAGVRRIKAATTVLQHVLNDGANLEPVGRDEVRIDFPEACLSALDSLVSFHRASLDILAGHFGGLIVPGREVVPTVKVGRHCKLPVSAIRETSILIGSRCNIAEDAELGSDVIISNNVVVDRRAVIRSSVIMPNTYVGELLDVTNAIVAGDRLIHVDTGTVTTITDSFMLASIRRHDIGDRLHVSVDRAIGVALLFASFCLWPIALVGAIIANPNEPILSRTLVGNRKRGRANIEFTAFEFAIKAPLFRYLPYLLAVASGHLRLVGVEPLEAADRSEEWKLDRTKEKVGLFRRVQLPATRDTPEKEPGLIEGRVVSGRSILEAFKWIERAAYAVVRRPRWRSARSSAFLPSRPMSIRAASTGFAVEELGRHFQRASFDTVTVGTNTPELAITALGGEERVNV